MNVNILSKLLVLATVYWGTGAIIGCRKETCDKQVFKTYTCYEVKLQNTEYTLDKDIIRATSKFDDDTISPTLYGLSLIFEVEKFTTYRQHGFTFFSTAYAGNCLPYKMQILDKIKKIDIYTINDFNSQYKAGDLITEAFVYLKNNELKDISFERVDSLVKRDDYYNIEEYSYGLVTPLYLNATPSRSAKIQFKVIVEFISGKTMTTYTREIYMKK